MRNTNLTIAIFNIRSLITKLYTFREIIGKYNYDIVLLSETWLHSLILDESVSLDGYTVFRNDREQGRRGGGVLIYVKSNIRCSVIKNLPANNSEQLWLSFSINKVISCIGVIYRVPQYSTIEFIQNLDDVLSILSPKYDNIYCGGDFNMDLLNISATYYNKFMSLLESFSLIQAVNEPTRVGPTSATLLDLFICSDHINVLNCSVKDLPNLSDHSLVSCVISCKVDGPSELFYTYRNFKHFNREHFYQDLLLVNFDQIFYIDDIDIKVSVFNELLLNLFNRYAPLITSRITKKHAPWLTENLKLIFKLRDKALAKFKKTKSSTDWEEFKRLRNYANREIKHEKKGYFQNKLKSSKKQIWKTLEDLNVHTKKRNSDIPYNISDVNKINQYFVNAAEGTKNPNKNTLNFYTNNMLPNVGEFFFRTVDTDTIKTYLFNIKTNAAGSDNISLRMLLYCCPFIIPYLTHLVNYCIENNVFPSLWKVVHVLPLPKIRNPKELRDLRPISMLSVLSKLLEYVLNGQMRAYLSDFNILPDNQSGFRPNHGCVTALLKVTDDILSASDNNKLSALVLLDYSKAFDRINHKLLLSILHYIGFTNSATTMMENYLSHRCQLVKIGQNKSNILAINSGVPQGSILGPLLFTIYTFKFSSFLNNCESHYYADDTQIYFSFSSDNAEDARKLINNDLAKLLETSEHHCLSLNPDKSKVMLFGSKVYRIHCLRNFHLEMDLTELQFVETARNLGLHMDSNLRFNEHVTKTIRKSYSNLKLLYGCSNLIDKRTKGMLCNSLVLSHFNFADIVYHPCLTKQDQARIQRVQNACIRFIFGCKRYESVSNKIVECNWLTMYQRRILHTCCFHHKLLRTKIPRYLFDKIITRGSVHNLNTRNRSLLTPPPHSSALYQRSFSYNITKLYNSLPNRLKQLNDFKFKKALKDLIFNKDFIIK